MIRIVIVDDHQIFIDGLMAMCQSLSKVEVVGYANNQQTGFKCIEQHLPDVAIIDINLVEGDGIDLVRIIKKKFPDVRMGMLTMHNNRTFIQQAVDAGALGYLLKNAGKDEFESAIHAFAEGKPYFSQEAMQTYISHYAEKDKEDNIEISLSARESEVLQLISKGLTNQAIADQLFISINTVKTHRKHLFEKLNVNNTAELVKFAMENHLLDED